MFYQGGSIWAPVLPLDELGLEVVMVGEVLTCCSTAGCVLGAYRGELSWVMVVMAIKVVEVGL